MSQRTLAPGVILIALGLFMLLIQTTSIGTEAIVAVIGGAFLVTYFATRIYGFLIPAGIMLGLGLGIVWQVEVGSGDGAVLIGLGLGFISIWLIGVLMRDEIRHWWPLVPGGIIATIGLLAQAEQTGFLRDYGDLWPLTLVVIGAALLLVQLTRPATPGREEQTEPSAPPTGTSPALPAAPSPSGNPASQ